MNSFVSGLSIATLNCSRERPQKVDMDLLVGPELPSVLLVPAVPQRLRMSCPSRLRPPPSALSAAGPSSSCSRTLAALCAVLLLLLSIPLVETRGGRRGGKGKGKTNLQFSQVAEFSLIHMPMADNRSAHIITGSHFSQIFRLGFKLRLICKASGEPRPMIKWFKEGAEMQLKPNVHFYEKPLGKNEIWSKLEIDPATMGDQGIYACVANNQFGVMAKNFKAEYTY